MVRQPFRCGRLLARRYYLCGLGYTTVQRCHGLDYALGQKMRLWRHVERVQQRLRAAAGEEADVAFMPESYMMPEELGELSRIFSADGTPPHLSTAATPFRPPSATSAHADGDSRAYWRVPQEKTLRVLRGGLPRQGLARKGPWIDGRGSPN